MQGNKDYIYKSIVVHGNHMGSKVGMPTANFDISALNDCVFPKDGVYGSIVTLSDNIEKFGVTIIGPKPSVQNESDKSFETHILDFNKNIYDEEIAVKIVKFIRNIKKFNSLEDVKAQVDKDKLWYLG